MDIRHKHNDEVFVYKIEVTTLLTTLINLNGIVSVISVHKEVVIEGFKM